MSTTVTTIKTSCGDDFRRFRAPDKPMGVSELRTRIQGLYDDRLGARTWQVFYVDSDGDLITIANSEDVELAFEAAAEAGTSTLRLYVQPERETPKARPSAARGVDPCSVFLEQLFGGISAPEGPPPGFCGPRGPFPWCSRPRGSGWRCGSSEAHAEAPKPAKDEPKAATPKPPSSPRSTQPEPKPTTVAAAPDEAVSSSAPVSPTSSETGPSEYVHVKAPEEPQPAAKEGTGTSDPAPAPSRWERELAILKEMGLTVDEERLTASLDRHQGIIAGVLSEVFARMQ
jgi:hypothetical protein